MRRYVIASILLASCGGDSNSFESEFVGRWTFDDGSLVTVNCPEEEPLENSIVNTGIEIVALGESRLQVTNSVPCSFEYRLEGATAILDPFSQECEVPDGAGGTAVETRATETISLAGETLTLVAEGRLGEPGGCTISVSGTLSR